MNDMERLLNNNHDGIDLPASIIVELLPFLDRKTWNSLILTNRDIYQASKEIEPPWPRGKFSVDHPDFIRDVTFSLDGNYFFVQTTGRAIHVWHERIGPYAVLYPTKITSMASSPTENLLVTASHNELCAHVLQFWDIASMSVVNEVLIPIAMVNVTSCAFSADGRLVACNVNSNYGSSSLHIYNASDAMCIKTITPNGHLNFGGFSPDSQTIVAGFHGRVIRVWDVAGDDDTAFEDISPWVPPSSSTPRVRLPCSPQGQSLIIGTASANVCKLAKYQNDTWVVKDLQLSMEDDALNFIFSPDGRLLAARKIDDVLALWDPVAGKLVQTLGECQHWTSLAFSGDGKRLAVAEARQVSLWPIVI
jgi:WD40 repeat protein